jgi:hypothetical protein
MFSVGKKLMFTTAALLASGALYSVPASAQATRTWVSGVGDDVNPCSRTAPCKTFPGAISKTAAGGEINCLDPGGFGGVTVVKSMTFICDFTEAGVLVTGTNAFTINAADTDVVTISGIDMFGPTTGPGLNGVRFINGAGVNIRNSTIKGFSSEGVSFEPGAGDTSFLNMDNVIIIGNGTVGDTTTGAIKVIPGTSATANVTLNNVRVSGNVNVGLRLDLTGTSSARINAVVVNSVLSNNTVGTQIKAPAGTGTVDATFSGVTISGNTSLGVLGNGATATGRFSASTITGNGAASAGAITGVNPAAGSTLAGMGNNLLDGNFNNAGTASNGAFNATVTPH